MLDTKEESTNINYDAVRKHIRKQLSSKHTPQWAEVVMKHAYSHLSNIRLLEAYIQKYNGKLSDVLK